MAKLLVAKSDLNKPIGFLNLVKPGGITSHDLVNAVRKITGIKQVGHSGTLDPMAQGVMVIGLSKACKLIQFLPDDKTYVAEVLFGTSTDTDDIEGKVINEQVDQKMLQKISSTDIGSPLKTFLGKIEQIPPAYSAIKINGVKMYEMARKGQSLAADAIKPRRVEVFSIDTLSFENPVLQLRISCSSGTYIRSIARDLGEMLKVGACLKSLLRERVGTFNLKEAITIDQFKILWQLENGQQENIQAIMSGANAINVPSHKLDQEILLRLVNGQLLDEQSLNTDKRGLFMACDQKREICLVLVQDGKMKAQVVLVSAEQLNSD